MWHWWPLCVGYNMYKQLLVEPFVFPWNKTRSQTASLHHLVNNNLVMSLPFFFQETLRDSWCHDVERSSIGSACAAVCSCKVQQWVKRFPCIILSYDYSGSRLDKQVVLVLFVCKVLEMGPQWKNTFLNLFPETLYLVTTDDIGLKSE